MNTRRSSAHFVSEEMDTIMAVVERSRRKQLESMVGLLDRLQRALDRTAMTTTNEAGETIEISNVTPTPLLSAADKRIAFLQGQIALGRNLLQRGASGTVQQQCSSGMEQLEKREVSSSESDDGLHVHQSLLPSRGSSCAPHVASLVVHDDEPLRNGIQCYQFENGSQFRAQWSNSGDALQERSESMSQRTLNRISESLRESHYDAHSKLTSVLQPLANKYNHKIDHDRVQNTKLQQRRPISYAAENLQYGMPAQNQKIKTMETALTGRQQPTVLATSGGTLEPQNHHHCALDVDLWYVRALIEECNIQLDEVATERLVLLEDSSRQSLVLREETESRALIEAMFFASLPVQRACKRACTNIYRLELDVQEYIQQISKLTEKLQIREAEKSRILSERDTSYQRLLDEVRDVVARERQYHTDTVEGLIKTSSEVIFESESSARSIIFELQHQAFVALLANVELNIVREGCASFRKVTHTDGGTHKDGFADICSNTSIVKQALRNLAASRLTVSQSTICQTNDSARGRWVTDEEQQELSHSWYTQNQVSRTVTTAFLYMLEESERQRIQDEEDDMFGMDYASWRATLQHYGNMKNLAMKDSQIAALQLDLAALRGSTLLSRSNSVADNPLSPSRIARQRPTPLRETTSNVFENATAIGIADGTFGVPNHSVVSVPRTSSADATPAAGLTTTTGSRSFYQITRSVSPPYQSEGSSIQVSRSASIRNTEQAFSADESRRFSGVSRSLIPDSFQLQTTGRVPTSRRLAPITLRGVEFPSVPVVVSMALTLEELGREEVQRAEATAWNHLTTESNRF